MDEEEPQQTTQTTRTQTNVTKPNGNTSGEREIAEVPDELRQLRACLYCSLVKVCYLSILGIVVTYYMHLFIRFVPFLQTIAQFDEHGCTNCPFLELRHNKNRVMECTTSNFEGYVISSSSEQIC